MRNITGTAEFLEKINIVIAGDLTSSDLNITGIIDGGGFGFADVFSLGISGAFSDTPDTPGVVRDVAFTAGDAAMGDVHLRSIIDINLVAGTVRNITGSAGFEFFFIMGDLTSNDLNITGIIDGGTGGGILYLDDGVVNNITFSAAPPAAGDLHLQNIGTIVLGCCSIVRGNITGSVESEHFAIDANLTRGLIITGIIDGGGGVDELAMTFGHGGVNNIAFSAENPAAGDLHLQNIEYITIGFNSGGVARMVNGNIDASGATAGVVFTLARSTVSGNVVGSPHDDTFNFGSTTIGGIIDGGGGDDNFIIGAGMTLSGRIDGGDGMDTLRLATDFTPTSANLFGGILTLTSSGGRLDLTLANIETIDIAGLTMVELPTIDMPPIDMPIVELPPVDMSMPSLVFAATAGDDVFAISSDITGSPERPLVSVIDGLGGQDELQLNNGAVVTSVSLNTAPPTGGAVHLQNVEAITIDGGTVNGSINIGGAATDMTLNLISGTISGDVNGSGRGDTFKLGGDISIGGFINGDVGRDELQINTGTAINNLAFSNQAPTQGDVHLIHIETITLNGGTVSGNIDVSGALAGPTFDPRSGANVVLRNNVRDGVTFNLHTGAVGGNVIGSRYDDVFIISGDMVGDGPTLDINGVIRGLGGRDELRLITGGVVNDIQFSYITGSLSVEPVEIITIDGGRVNGNIDVGGATAGMTLNLRAGAVGGNVIGSAHDDVFVISGDMTGANPALAIGGVIKGVGGIAFNSLHLIEGAAVDSIAFSDLAPSSGALHLQNIQSISLIGGARVNGNIDVSAAAHPILPQILFLYAGSIFGDIIGSGRNDHFVIRGDMTGATPELAINGVIDGRGGTGDTIELSDGAVVASIAFSDQAPGGGAIHAQNIETIGLYRGTVTGNIDASGMLSGANSVSRYNIRDGVTFNLHAGAVGGDVIGSDHNDIFNISGDMTGDSPALDIRGVIRGHGGRDEVRLITGAAVDNLAFSSQTPAQGDVHLLDILTITLNGGLARGNIDASASASGGGGVNFNLRAGAIFGDVIGGSGFDYFIISGDMTGANPELAINGVIKGAGGIALNLLHLIEGAAVDSIAFSDLAPSGGALHLQNVQFITLGGGRVNGNIDTSAAVSPIIPLIFFLRAGSIFGDIIGSGFKDYFVIRGDMTGANPELAINGVIDGGGGTHDTIVREDAIVLDGVGAVVTSIAFSDQAPTSGALHLQNIDAIGLYGGTVTGNIDASNAPAGVRFFLTSGSILGNVIGSAHNDDFYLESSITINGFIEGGAGRNSLHYTGAAVRYQLSGHGGLYLDATLSASQEDQRAIEEDEITVPILRVRNFEDLSLSPALNLYGAMSDALMQFGAQTAQGFQLADLNLTTGRATQLMSQDSPFVQGKVWAHKITHSGNGKGSIGLGITGLTARDDSDYDYEMSLTQHGFDAPLAATKLGAFNLRAVSHTMTGVIETDIAEAQVFGYGAGVALLWQKHNFSAHLTSLAGAYEVEATTSSLNPRAVVNEVSEGSFSAVNAVVSAGLADKRELAYGLSLRTTADVSWQTLSLDDFSETGSGGIAVNFDKATRFTARIGAALEAEHWFSDVVFVHETSSGGTLSSGLSQDYRQDDGTAFEMKLGGKIADLATGLTLKAHAGLRASLNGSDALDPSARFDLNWRF